MVTCGFEVIGDLTGLVSVYGKDEVRWGKISKWEIEIATVEKSFSKLASNKNKKLKTLLKKGVKSRWVTLSKVRRY